MALLLIILLRVISFLSLTSTMALAISLSLPGCQEKCGNVTIPYPFGIGSECSANSSFTVFCLSITNPPTAYLSLGGMDVIVKNISLYGTITVHQPEYQVNCSNVHMTRSLPISLKGSPFTISAHYNSLVVLGCQNSVWLRVDQTTVGGCTPMCDANSIDLSCSGVNCCQITIPSRLQELDYIYESNQASNNSVFCGYVFPVDSKWWQKNFLNYDFPSRNPASFILAPIVLEWEFDDGTEIHIIPGSTCTSRSDYNDFSSSYEADSAYYSSISEHNKDDVENDYISSIRYCICIHGFEGNPYVPDGCSDIDECANVNESCKACINLIGSFSCEYTDSRLKTAFMSIASALGAMVLVFTAWRLSLAIRKRIKAYRRHKFFRRNGGLLLSATENGLEKTKLYSSKQLTHATNHYNENRILGRGGQGTVYKGMLTDGRIVAVKKSRRVNEADLKVFINEVVILSQVNHRNVVKLMGCCLETDVPLLVYEFIPNGTLFQHIHEPNEEFQLTWEMRVKIAREVAGALVYLHSAASTPIYHRDIKSTNILLDDKYRAKVSDFGTSRSIAIDQTHLTTQVLGTFGYLDPEYFQSSQFTEKSDVYSFGVVMVELLTGERAVSSIREEGKGLATHFLQSMKENQLFDILDARVQNEGKKEEIVSIAELARRCLHLNGKRRPTMKEVAVELENINMLKEGTCFEQILDEDEEWNDTDEIGESDGFFSIFDYSEDTQHPFLDEP